MEGLYHASTAAVRDFNPAYDRYGSEADITRHLADVRFTPESGHPIFHAALGWRDQTATRYDLRNIGVRWRTHSSAGKLLSSGLQSVAEFDCDLQAV
jgi:hypothetical protein